MEGFVARITTVNNAVNSFAWGPLMLLLLVGTGFYQQYGESLGTAAHVCLVCSLRAD